MLFVFLVRERNNLAFFSSPACTKLAAGLEIESLEKWKKYANNQRGGPTDNQQWHKKNRFESLILQKQVTCLQRYLHHNTHDSRCERQPDPKQRWLTGHFLQRAKLSFYFSHKLMDESALLLKELILQPSFHSHALPPAAVCSAPAVEHLKKGRDGSLSWQWEAQG